jgi:hypothetical protein
MLEDTWSVDLSVGLDIGELNLKLGPSITWSQTQSSTVQHSISIQVAPGQMVWTNVFHDNQKYNSRRTIGRHGGICTVQKNRRIHANRPSVSMPLLRRRS